MRHQISAIRISQLKVGFVLTQSLQVVNHLLLILCLGQSSYYIDGYGRFIGSIVLIFWFEILFRVDSIHVGASPSKSFKYWVHTRRNVRGCRERIIEVLLQRSVSFKINDQWAEAMTINVSGAQVIF